MSKAKIHVTISKVLDHKPVVVWSWWKNVDSLDNALNKTKLKIPLLYLKFNVTSDLVSRLSGEGLDNGHPKYCVVNADREETTNFSKEA